MGKYCRKIGEVDNNNNNKVYTISHSPAPPGEARAGGVSQSVPKRVRGEVRGGGLVDCVGVSLRGSGMGRGSGAATQ